MSWKQYFIDLIESIKQYAKRDRSKDKEIMCNGFANPMANTIDIIGK